MADISTRGHNRAPVLFVKLSETSENPSLSKKLNLGLRFYLFIYLLLWTVWPRFLWPFHVFFSSSFSHSLLSSRHFQEVISLLSVNIIYRTDSQWLCSVGAMV